MVNFKLGNEMWKWINQHDTSVGQRKILSPRQDIMLMNSLSHFITKLKFHHLYWLITTHDDFDSIDPSSMQDTCHIWTQLNDLALHEFS